MIENNVSLDLMEFIETNVLPRYANFDKAHNLFHVTRVINKSLTLSRQIGTDINMCYTIAAYHDLGLEGPRAVHHITGGKIIASDVRLRKWFSAEQIKIMKEAIEDHRASASHAPRSIYGKIVAEADRVIDGETIIRRTIQFGFTHYASLDREAHIKRAVEHLREKYGRGGYLKLWIPWSDNATRLNALQEMIADDSAVYREIVRIYDLLQGEA